MSALRILGVEDEGLVATGLRAQLKALGHQVVGLARDGDEALLWRALALVVRAGREGVGIRLPRETDADLQRLIQVHALARATVPVLQLPEADGPGPLVMPEAAIP